MVRDGLGIFTAQDFKAGDLVLKIGSEQQQWLKAKDVGGNGLLVQFHKGNGNVNTSLAMPLSQDRSLASYLFVLKPKMASPSNITILELEWQFSTAHGPIARLIATEDIGAFTKELGVRLINKKARAPT